MACRLGTYTLEPHTSASQDWVCLPPVLVPALDLPVMGSHGQGVIMCSQASNQCGCVNAADRLTNVDAKLSLPIRYD